MRKILLALLVLSIVAFVAESARIRNKAKTHARARLHMNDEDVSLSFKGSTIICTKIPHAIKHACSINVSQIAGSLEMTARPSAERSTPLTILAKLASLSQIAV